MLLISRNNNYLEPEKLLRVDSKALNDFQYADDTTFLAKRFSESVESSRQYY